MSNASSKRSVMTLFSNKNDIYCHQVKIVLAEKGVAYENEEVDLQALSEDLMELNPYGTLPTLVDRDLVLFSSRIIMEYLDERFPHPPLMPVYPVSRAKSRLLMLRIEQDWYPTLEIAEKGTEVEREEALKQLKEELLAVSVIFQQTPYFIIYYFIIFVRILKIFIFLFLNNKKYTITPIFKVSWRLLKKIIIFVFNFI